VPESALEVSMRWQLTSATSVTRGWVQEHVFAHPRKWRFDFAWPDLRVALEVEGGTFMGRGHAGGQHFESDCEKYNTAALLGWMVIRVTGKMVNDGRAIATVEQALTYRSDKDERGL
jgi:very-short-patch-repair endonuclease